MRSQRRSLLVLLVPFLFTIGCDLKTTVRYDRNVDFTELRTYAWEGRNHPEISALGQGRIVYAVDSELQAKGLRKVSTNPDMVVSYFADDDERIVIDTAQQGQGYGREWDGAGVAGPVSSSETYREGTVVVDIYRAEGKQLIWRGSVTGAVSANPEKIEKIVKKAVAKLFKKFPPPSKKR